jgi:outer membrane protein OmpA-like peptidoglycan-associated protein
MSKQFLNIIVIVGFLLIASMQVSNAQKLDSVKKYTLLVRDSLDFLDKKLNINTSNNEFSPISYKDGLLYISNKPIKEAKVAFNKIYWTNDPNFNIIDREQFKVNNVSIDTKYIKLGKGDDFTAPTSNDNNILVNYKRLKKSWNEIDYNFRNFSTDQAFYFNDSVNLLIYAKKGNKRVNGIRHWELWQANLLNGRLRHKRKLIFDDKNANYLYPFVSKDLSKLFFASDKKGSKGGFDIYYVSFKEKKWEAVPNQLDSNINTQADELAPFIISDTLYFSSNRVGGLGGFDVYNTKLSNPFTITNLGYPINSIEDEVSMKVMANSYFLTTNRNNNFDILSLQHLPLIYPITGLLTYKSDGSLVANHSIYLKDLAEDKIIDSFSTDGFAKYRFKGKPNRNYEFLTVNGNGVLENINYNTIPNQTNFEYSFSIAGSSPKQKADSINALIAANDKRILDSIDATGITTKFVVHYGFNKYTIDKKEKFVLDYLLTKLKNLPNTYIAIGAFTDCIGSNKYNYKLSVNRAKSVYNYLVSHGLNKKQILTNGYAKKFNITPCITKSSKNSIKAQSDNRRAEIVLSNEKDQNWEKLEKARGASYYKIFNANSKILNNSIFENTRVVPAKDTVAKSIVVAIPFVKKDTVAKVVPVVVKKDTVAKAVVVAKPVIKKDTIVAKVIIAKSVVKKDTVVAKAKVPVVVKKDTVAKAVVVAKPVLKKDTIAKVTPMVITQAKQVETDDLSKEEIIKALDSLAKLKIEQERIVAYLTLRLNNKPIDIYVSSDTVTVELYDNGVHDRDSVSVIYNNRIVVDRQELKVNQPIKFKLKVDKNRKNNELVMVAENLGTEPPNTAVMFITEKSGKRQQVVLNTDMTHNGVVYFIRIGKQ